jgi:hypothetical protein
VRFPSSVNEDVKNMASSGGILEMYTPEGAGDKVVVVFSGIDVGAAAGIAGGTVPFPGSAVGSMPFPGLAVGAPTGIDVGVVPFPGVTVGSSPGIDVGTSPAGVGGICGDPDIFGGVNIDGDGVNNTPESDGDVVGASALIVLGEAVPSGVPTSRSIGSISCLSSIASCVS